MRRLNQARGHRPGPSALGSIRTDEVMPAREFCRRLGLGVKAWTALVKRGLPVTRCGKQAFVDGAAAVAFFRQQTPAACDGSRHEIPAESVAAANGGGE